LTPPDMAAVFLADLLANCFLGAFDPVFFLAVYLVLAMGFIYYISKSTILFTAYLHIRK
jgi:hypothetical protein